MNWDQSDAFAQTAKYAVYQYETCPLTDKVHKQGMVQFKRPVRLNQAKRLLGSPSIHLEPMKGTAAQARDYCLKEDTRLRTGEEFGDFPVRREGAQTWRVLWRQLEAELAANPSSTNFPELWSGMDEVLQALDSYIRNQYHGEH